MTKHMTWLVPLTLGAGGAIYLIDRRARASEPRPANGAGTAPTYWQHFAIAIGQRAPHVEALARIVSSEAGDHAPAVQRLVAWMARNRSQHLRRAMRAMARGASDTWGPITAERPFSTSRPALPAAAQLARDVLGASQRRDIADGATHIFNRVQQDQLHARGQVGTDAAAVVHIWTTYRHLRHVKDVGPWTLYGVDGNRAGKGF